MRRGAEPRTGRLLLVFTMLLVSAAPLEAQRGRRGPQNRAQLEERIRARMGQMIQSRLGLDEDGAAALSDVVQEFEALRREIRTREQATRSRVEAFMLEGGTDEAEATELLERMADLREAEAALYRAEQERLLEVLTPAQVVEFQTLRAQLGQRIRALQGRPGGRRGRGGPGAPPGVEPP